METSKLIEIMKILIEIIEYKVDPSDAVELADEYTNVGVILDRAEHLLEEHS